MSNILDFQMSAKNPSKVSGAGTSIKYFSRPVPGGGGWPSLSSAAPWSTLYSSSPNSNTPQSPNVNVASTSLNPNSVLWVPVNSFDGVPFDVYACGTFGSDSGDPSGTVNIQLQAVTGTLQNPVYTTVASTTALTPNYTTAQPWLFQVTLLGDSVTGLLTGNQVVMKDGTFAPISGTTPRVLDTIVSGLDFQNGNKALQQGAVFGLVVGVTFATSDPTNKATLTTFTVES